GEVLGRHEQAEVAENLARRDAAVLQPSRKLRECVLFAARGERDGAVLADVYRRHVVLFARHQSSVSRIPSSIGVEGNQRIVSNSRSQLSTRLRADVGPAAV